MSGFRIATIRGIPIRIHPTFIVALPFLAFGFARAFREATLVTKAEAAFDGIGGDAWLWGLAMTLLLFVSVLLHELAHSLYALRKGGQVRDITLLLIGGVSQISELPKRPRDEAVMALVGPLVSVSLGVALYALHSVLGGTAFALRFGVYYLANLNLFIGVFNLLPAFPMDGGRILRAVLAGKMGFVRATGVAATVGKVFAVVFGIWGFLSLNMLLLLIAFFIFVGAEAESRAAAVKAAVRQLRVGDLMMSHVFSIAATASVHEAAERMLRERRLSLLVTDGGRAQGLITLEAVQSVPPERRSDTPVRAVTWEALSLSPDDDASKALLLMEATGASEIGVVDDDHLIGMVNRNDIAEMVRLNELADTQRRLPAADARRGRVPTQGQEAHV